MFRLKKTLLILLCFMISSSRYSFVYASDIEGETKTYAKGDVNGDGKISTLDYVALKKYLKNTSQLPDGSEDAADANGDSAIDEYDLLRLKNMVYYGEIEDLEVSVASRSIHPQHQKNFLHEGYMSISKYWNGSYPADRILLQYDEQIISEGSRYTVLVSEDPDMSNAKQYVSSSRSVYVENSKVKQLYFWTVSNGTSISTVQSFYVDDSSPRNLSITTIENIRDIGGYETDDGMVISQGLVYRGYMLENNRYLSSNRDFIKNELGIKTEIDMARCTVLMDVENYYSYFIGFPITAYYLKPNYSGTDKNNIVKIFEVLGDESKYPVYIHCHIGTDRTGFLCFLMNALCGVSKEDCYTDYVFSGFSGNHRSANGLDENCVKHIEAAPGRTFAEKTYNMLVERGVNPQDLDNFISIMKEKKAQTKSYVSTPRPVETILHYDGSEKTLRFADDYLFNVKGNKATQVGDYTAVVSLKDPVTYSWADGSKSDKAVSWTIEDVRVPVEKPDLQIEEYVYDGEPVEIAVEDKEYYTVSGNTATDAGEYEVVISLSDKEKYMWDDGSNEDLRFAWSIQKADIDLSQVTFEDLSCEYDGTEKILIYEGELPKGVASLEYTDNVLTGNPYTETSIEVTMHIVLEDENYNPVEDRKAILTILPIYDDLTLHFEAEDIEPLNIRYGEEYSLPSADREGMLFEGWSVLVDGEYVKVEADGVWEYEFGDDEVTLFPIFVPLTESEELPVLEEGEDETLISGQE